MQTQNATVQVALQLLDEDDSVDHHVVGVEGYFRRHHGSQDSDKYDEEQRPKHAALVLLYTQVNLPRVPLYILCKKLRSPFY